MATSESFPTPDRIVWFYGDDWAAIYDKETGRLLEEGHDGDVTARVLHRLGYKQTWDVEFIDPETRQAFRTLPEAMDNDTKIKSLTQAVRDAEDALARARTAADKARGR